MEKINDILSLYDLHYKKVTLLSKGYASKKWLIVDEEEKKYILKEIVNQTEDRLNSVLLIQSNLNELSPKIIKDKSNNLYVCYNQKKYYLSEYLNNKDYDINLQLQSIGNFMATLHKKMSLIKNIHTTFLKIENNTSILKKYLKYHQMYNNLDYIEIIKYKLSILDKLKLENINFNKLTKQIIHGDFYTDNILYTGSSYKIIDFDQCCEFYKEYEVLRGMFMICNNDTKFTKNKKILMIQFIKGYYDIDRVYSPEDAYNFYLYIQANSLSSIKPEDFGKIEKMNFAKKRFNILKSLVENKEEILKILKGEFI